MPAHGVDGTPGVARLDPRQDQETGLTYLHVPYYDPALGVSLSPDPLRPGLPALAWAGINTLAAIRPAVAARFALYTDADVRGPLIKALKRPGWGIVRAIA